MEWTYDFDEKTVSNPGNIPNGIPLVAMVTNVREMETGPNKTKKMVVDFDVAVDANDHSAQEKYSMFISEKQGYLTRDLLSAVGVDPQLVRGKRVTTDQFRDTFKDKAMTLTFGTREWEGREMKEVKKIASA